MGSYTFLIGSYGFNLVNMVNLGRFRACLTHMRYPLKPEFLTFLDALASLGLLYDNLGQSVRWNLLKNTILSDIFFEVGFWPFGPKPNLKKNA